MEAMDSVEARQLVKLQEKFLTVAEAVHAFRNNLKCLKLCKKLINLEIKTIKKSKVPIEDENREIILNLYADLRTIVKGIVKSKKIQSINKYCEELDETIFSVKIQIAELKGTSAINTVAETTKKVAKKLGDAAQIIGEVVDGKVDSLKKLFAAEENLKSE